jgi:hypothetical protein
MTIGKANSSLLIFVTLWFMLPRHLMSQDREVPAGTRIILLTVRCDGDNTVVCKDATDKDREVANTLHADMPFFVFTISPKDPHCGILDITIVRFGSMWKARLTLHRYRHHCKDLEWPSPAPFMTIDLKANQDATHHDFATRLAKSIHQFFVLRPADHLSFQDAIRDAVPFGFDATFKDTSGRRAPFMASMLVRRLNSSKEPSLDTADHQSFATAIYNMRNVDASTGRFVFRFTGMGCISKTDVFEIQAEPIKVVEEDQATDPKAGRDPGADDYSKIRSMVHNVVYFLSPGRIGECDLAPVQPKTFTPGVVTGTGGR